MNWNTKTVLITGGTGSFGNQLVETMLASTMRPKKLIVFSRDELKQHEMRRRFPDGPASAVRYFLGDVRDQARLERAFHGVDVVIHAAALKQVPACEYNPFEAIKTNVLGAKNVIDAAINQGVERVLALSTDKAVNPVNLYGATKLCAEKLFIDGNSYAGAGPTKFSCARYGNVVASRGSVVPLFLEQRKAGTITVTDQRMTRFWITLQEGVRFVASCIEQMRGGEIFIPKIPSMNIMALAKVLAPKSKVQNIGIRPGEKLHEVLISEDEARYTIDAGDRYVIFPASAWNENRVRGSPLPEGATYTSNNNTDWLDSRRIRKMIGDVS